MTRSELWTGLLLAALVSPAAAAPSGQLDDVVIKAQEKDEPSAGKPALDVPYDPYETLRPSLKPDDALLLAQPPSQSRWVAARPRRLREDRLIQPWNDLLTPLAGLEVPVRAQLGADAKASGKDRRWSLSLVDEDGKPIRSFEGQGEPPASVAWDGKTDAGDWIRAGHAYSAVYKFSDAGTPAAPARTVLGQPIRFEGLVRETAEGRVLGLDTSELFGTDRRGQDLAAGGQPLVRVAADFVRRRAFGAPLSLRLFGPDALTAEMQAAAVKAAMARELGIPADRIAAEASAAGASDQRLELLVSGR